MRIYDISVPVNNQIPVWPGDPPFVRTQLAQLEKGDVANVSHVETGVHVGTHVDAPFHFIPGGKTIDQLPLEVLIGPVQVVEIDDTADTISAERVKNAGISKDTRRILFKTRNSQIWGRKPHKFDTGFVALEEGAAKYLVSRGVQLVGIDYFSIAPYTHPRPTHLVLLNAGVVIIEGLDLRQVSPGEYTLYCLPIKIEGADGAPARVILTGSNDQN